MKKKQPDTNVYIEGTVKADAKSIAVKQGIPLYQYVTEALREKNTRERKKLREGSE